jgi:hypothetical protein
VVSELSGTDFSSRMRMLVESCWEYGAVWGAPPNVKELYCIRVVLQLQRITEKRIIYFMFFIQRCQKASNEKRTVEALMNNAALGQPGATKYSPKQFIK